MSTFRTSRIFCCLLNVLLVDYNLECRTLTECCINCIVTFTEVIHLSTFSTSVTYTQKYFVLVSVFISFTVFMTGLLCYPPITIDKTSLSSVSFTLLLRGLVLTFKAAVCLINNLHCHSAVALEYATEHRKSQQMCIMYQYYRCTCILPSGFTAAQWEGFIMWMLVWLNAYSKKLIWKCVDWLSEWSLDELLFLKQHTLRWLCSIWMIDTKDIHDLWSMQTLLFSFQCKRPSSELISYSHWLFQHHKYWAGRSSGRPV